MTSSTSTASIKANNLQPKFISSEIIKTQLGMEISGRLVFSNVADLLKQGNEIITSFSCSNSDANFVIDCNALERMDSAGIATLIEWQRQCINLKLLSQFFNLPDQSKSLIETYRLKNLLLA